MKKTTAGVAGVLAVALMIGACAKHDDTSNVTVTNETVVNETDTSVVSDNLASPDATANGADVNASAGNSL